MRKEGLKVFYEGDDICRKCAGHGKIIVQIPKSMSVGGSNGRKIAFTCENCVDGIVKEKAIHILGEKNNGSPKRF